MIRKIYLKLGNICIKVVSDLPEQIIRHRVYELGAKIQSLTDTSGTILCTTYRQFTILQGLVS